MFNSSITIIAKLTRNCTTPRVGNWHSHLWLHPICNMIFPSRSSWWMPIDEDTRKRKMNLLLQIFVQVPTTSNFNNIGKQIRKFELIFYNQVITWYIQIYSCWNLLHSWNWMISSLFNEIVWGYPTTPWLNCDYSLFIKRGGDNHNGHKTF